MLLRGGVAGVVKRRVLTRDTVGAIPGGWVGSPCGRINKVPYIKDEDKRDLLGRVARKPGELNFLVTEIIADYWYFGDKNYQAINDILGALEGAKLEFYRRIAGPYEDKKIQENGDIY